MLIYELYGDLVPPGNESYLIIHDPTNAKTLVYWLRYVAFEYKIIAAFSDNFETPTDFTELLI